MTTFEDRVELQSRVTGTAASVHRRSQPLGRRRQRRPGRRRHPDRRPVVTTLLPPLPAPKATNGKPGGGGNRSGKDGEDLILPVPDGTVVLDKAGNVLADLVGHGTSYVAAQGGRGGLGNAALASARRRLQLRAARCAR